MSLSVAQSNFDPDRRLVAHRNVLSGNSIGIVKLLVCEAHFEALGHHGQDCLAGDLSKVLPHAYAPTTEEWKPGVWVALLAIRCAG